MDLDHPSLRPPPTTPASAQAQSEARRLIDLGLSFYGRGEIESAARIWIAARNLDPHNARAQRYLDHVSEHDALGVEGLAPAGFELLRAQPEMPGPPRPNDVPDYIPNPPEATTPAAMSPFAPTQALASQHAPEAPPPPPPLDPDPVIAAALAALRECIGRDDFSGAIEASERVLERAPSHAEALSVRARATENLIQLLEAKVGDLSAIPSLRIPADEVIWLNLNHREGFILSQIDGVMSYEDILDVCGMPRLEALRVLAHLVTDKVIGHH